MVVGWMFCGNSFVQRWVDFRFGRIMEFGFPCHWASGPGGITLPFLRTGIASPPAIFLIHSENLSNFIV